MKLPKTYEESLRYLYGLQKYGIKFGLNKTSNLLKVFGNPHKRNRYIHIGGTNGKGSICIMLESILRKAGLKVGLYTSPHLVRFTERFRIDGKEIPKESVVELVRSLISIMDPSDPPTFFELTTAMAILYFDMEDVDISIMEVGMGGRLDATNIIRPELSIITNISMEHRQFLGNTTTQIAREKAGIIKRGVELVTGVKQRHIRELFKDMCKSRGSRMYLLGRDFRYRSTKRGFSYYGIWEDLKDMELSLEGRFQRPNAAIAIAASEILKSKGYGIEADHIRDGLKDCIWPGRMQIVSKEPLIILDGAHNPAAMKALINSLRNIPSERIITVIGIMDDKDIKGILSAIIPISSHIIFTRAKYFRAMDPHRLKEIAQRLKRGNYEVISEVKGAINRAKEYANREDVILITGSLFIIGEALCHLRPGEYEEEMV